MKSKNRLITLAAFFAMVLSMVPTLNVKAAGDNDILIISETNVSAEEAAKWAESKGATDTFIDLADLYWEYAEDHGEVNPGVAYVQAAKETGFGKFGGVLDESYCNPCGLKNASGGNDNDASAHEKFESWKQGVQAHLDHLALYAGASGYPRSDTYDPRHFATIKGRAETVNSLSANWAPSATYGEEVNKYYRQMVSYSDEKIGDEEVEEDLKDKESDTKVETSKEPYPAAPENKPAGLNVKKAVTVLTDNIKADDKPNDSSANGWKKEDGVWHYYDSAGNKVTGWLKSNNNWYLFDKSGNMCFGWVNDNGVFYYFNDSGIMATGWKKLGEDWYFFRADGQKAVGAVNDGNNTYYLESSGIMKKASGWNFINDKWYYFNSNNTLKTGWFKDNNMWYYLQADGTMCSNGYYLIDSKTYGFDNNGKMISGWKQENNVSYYFANSGDMVTGWKQIDGKWYYFYDNGAMAKGWIKLDNSWYYLNSSGVMVTGWTTYDGSKYYLNPSSGKLTVNTTVDGYSIGSDGKAVSNVSNTSNSSASGNNTANNSSNNTTSNSNTANNSGGTVLYDKPQVSGNIIIVDPGHNYGGDYGAVKTINGVKYDETVLNMQVAVKLKAELENKGYTVIMTREENDRSTAALTQSLTERVNIANNSAACLFISIHHNVASGTAMGVEAYYSTTAQDDSFGGNYSYERVQKGKALASAITANVASAVSTNNRGARDSSLFVCRNTSIPAVLVEVGFIDNPTEAARCASTDGQAKAAKAIADAVSVQF